MNFKASIIFTAVDKFTSTFGRISKSFEDGEKKGKSFTDVMLGMLSAQAITAFASRVTDALHNMTVGFINATYEMANVALHTKVTVNELMALRYVSQQLGLANDALEKSYQNLDDQIDQMKINTGSLLNHMIRFQDKGLYFQLKAAKSVSDQFQIVIKRMASMSNEAQRGALAQAAFGSAGKEIARILEVEGVGAIDMLMERYKGLSTEIDSNSIGAVKRLNQSWVDIKTLWSSIMAEALLPLVPLIEEISADILDWAKANKDMIATGVKDFLTGMVTATKYLITLTKEFIEILNSSIKFFNNYGSVIKDTAVFLGILAAAFFANAIAMGVEAGGVTALIVVYGLYVAALWSAVAAHVALYWPIYVVAGIIFLMYKYWEPLVEIADKYLGILKEIIKWGAKAVLGINIFGDDNPDQNRFGFSDNSQMVSPNQSQVDSRNNIDFAGVLNINGAPAGSTVQSNTTGAAPIRLNLLGDSTR